MRNSIWLELATADPVAMKAKILAGGGKVFRLISDVEDTSQWER